MTPTARSAPRLAVPHGFFGREGGVSEGLYASLNAGPGSRDDPAAVAENRRRIAAAIGVAPERLLSLHQIHSAEAVIVEAPWTGQRPQADAIATAAPGLALCVLTADCAPVLFADAEAGVIAAAHAGWKGAFGGVLEAAVEAMERLGARRDRIVAEIGPTIAQASYEIGPEFKERFLEADAGNARFFASGEGDRDHFDLVGYCRARLAAVGVYAGVDAAADTFTEETALFSHRRSVKRGEPDYGRNASVIALPGG